MEKKGLIITVKTTDLDIFEELIGVLREVIDDERIEVSVRHEIANSVLAIGEKYKINMEESHA